MNKFDIIEFNRCIEQGDSIAFDYIEEFLPENLKTLHEIVINLNYILYLGESTKIIGDIQRIYEVNKNMLFIKFLESQVEELINNEE